MNNQQAIDRLVKHLEWGWSEETVEAIKMGIHALKETQWIPISERLPVIPMTTLCRLDVLHNRLSATGMEENGQTKKLIFWTK